MCQKSALRQPCGCGKTTKSECLYTCIFIVPYAVLKGVCELFYINENSDVLKLSKPKEIEGQITASIYGRLRDWNNYEWLEEDDDGKAEGKTKPEKLKSCFEKFYRYIGKKNIPQGIKNWECGLGQILGGLDDNAESVLPYILTAYMYNFADYNGSKFVTAFFEGCEDYGINLNKLDSLRDDFFGCTQPKENKYPSKGIGYLLTSRTPKNAGRFNEQLKKFANRFVLKDLAWMSTMKIDDLSHPRDIDADTLCELDVSYIVPLDRLTSWHRGLVLHTLRSVAEEPEYVDLFISYSGKRNYDWTSWWQVFLTWYHVLKKDYVVDPVACLLLLNHAIVQVNQGNVCKDAEEDTPILKINTIFDDRIKKGEIGELRKEMELGLEDEFRRCWKDDVIVPPRFTRIPKKT